MPHKGKSKDYPSMPGHPNQRMKPMPMPSRIKPPIKPKNGGK